MKVGTKEMYDDFVQQSINQKEILKAEKNAYQSSKDYLMDKIAPYKHYIETFTNIKYQDISNLDRLLAERSIIKLVDIVGVDSELIRRTVNVIVQINRSVAKINQEIEQINNDTIAYKIFKEVIYRFNKKISDQIVYKGYTLSLGHGLGNIRIKKVNCIYNRDGSLRVKRNIDWDGSNKRKKEIIEAGGLPYKVIKRNGKEIVEDNGGEKWFVYHAKEWDYLWYWSKGRCQVMNSQYYRFSPTKYNNTSRDGSLGNVHKLKHLVTTNSPLLSNFTETMIESNRK